MSRQARHATLRRTVLAASVAACFSLSGHQAAANPTGGSVVSGSASFAAAGSTLTITNSANTIINWQGFSIGVNEITRFLQSSAGSAVLNRVVGAGGVIPQSVIDGVLSSNGRVFLLNPMGVVIGPGARIDVAGLVASSLNLSNEDFLAGRMRFTEVPGAGGIANHGTIETASGGRVFLVAPSVENHGIIKAPQGEILLAAGKSAELVSEASPFVTVKISADAEQALNVGSLIADSGRIGMYGAVVRNSGVAAANGAVAGPGGQIRFVAAKDLTLDAGSRVSANGPDGGKVLLQAETGTTLVHGTVEALGSDGRGGEVQILGERVGLLGTGSVDVSGATGGGTILLGGDYKGGNPLVQNALRAAVGPSAVLRADARDNGDGGRVIVWADEATAFYGSISARGGDLGGNGGFVETSGKQSLIALGSVNTGAPLGKGGTWLLDPSTIRIDGAGSHDVEVADGSLLFDDPPVSSIISNNGINAAMASGGNVVLEASENIIFQQSVDTSAYGGSLTATAGWDVRLGEFTVTTGGDLSLTAGTSITSTASASTMQLRSTDGAISLSAGWYVNVAGLRTYGRAVTVSAATGDIVTSSILTQSAVPGSPGGDVRLVTTDGVITVNGSIDARGAYGNASSPAGTAGGSVILSRTGDTTPGSAAILVTGNIYTGGGNGASGSDGSAGAGGDSGHVYITKDPDSPWSMYPIVGDVTITGAINTTGGLGAAATNPSDPRVAGVGGDGGQGGDVVIASTGTLRPNQISTGGGWAGNGGAFTVTDNTGESFTVSAQGGNGGDSGSVTLVAGADVFTSINANGGVGGLGGTVTVAGSIASLMSVGVSASGGSGGAGGSVSINAGGQISASSINTYGGGGQNGGGAFVRSDIGDGASVSAYANGGDGGTGGEIYLSSGGPLQVGTLYATGGSGGIGGTATIDGSSASWANPSLLEVSASGGSGFASGYLELQGSGISGSTIYASGGTGGSGGTATLTGSTTAGNTSVFVRADGGGGGSNSENSYVNLSADGESGITFTGDIYVGGGNGAPGGTATATITLESSPTVYVSAGGGEAGDGGYANIVQPASVSIVGVNTRGGSGGAGGTASLAGSLGSSNAFVYASGQSGNSGGYLYVDIYDGTFAASGTLDLRGGNGGNGGNAVSTASTSGSLNLDASGGTGGYGGSVDVYASAVQTAGITTRGGAGADAGNTGPGGSGGDGNYIYLETYYEPYGAVRTTETLDASGGAGGAGAGDGSGGSGGNSGSVAIYGNSIETAAITTRGGNGANAGSNGSGGEGGWGSSISLDTRYYGYGPVTTTALLDASGGDGGAAGTMAGERSGSGGNAGYVEIYASSIQAGNITARGGDAANGSNTGYGGSGGSGSYIWLDTGYFSPYGTVSTEILDASGGNGGAGGAAATGDASGGWGGNAGSVDIYARAIDTGDIKTRGGNAADAGSSGSGGMGGFGNYIWLDTRYYDYGAVNTGALDASGGNGSAGAAATAGTEAGPGGHGGDGHSIHLYGSAITVNGNILSTGGAGGRGGSGNASYTGGTGGSGGAGADYNGGGETILLESGSTITVTGLIDGSGGAGGAGGAYSGQGGNGGYGGDVLLSANNAALRISGGVYSQGGSGGAGGVNHGSGGSGGDGYNSVTLYGVGTAPNVYVDGGAGGAAVGEGGGGSGGWAGGVSLYGFSVLGNVSARGGLGAMDVYGGASSGDNGSVNIYPYNGSLTQSGLIAAGSVWIYPDVAGDVMLNNPANWVSSFYTGGTVSGNVSVASTGVMDMTASVAATGSVSIQNLTTTPGSSLYAGVWSSGGSIVLVADNVDTSGGISTSGAFQWYSLNAQPIGVDASFFANISAAAIRLGDRTIGSDITLVGDIDLGSTTALSLLTSTGLITQSGGGGLTAAALNAEGANVILTSTTNAVGTLQGRATGTDFSFANSSGFTLGTVDATNLTPGVASAGYATLTALTGDIINGVTAAAPAVSGAIVQLMAPAGSLGTAALPLEVGAPVLEAAAGTGVYLALNRYAPALVTANYLSNTVSGDIDVKAWGGLITTTLVSNPVGAVMLGTFSPLQVQSGALAATGISLSTSGTTSNDMQLDGTFTPGSGGLNLTIGAGGALLLGLNYTGTITSQTGGTTAPTGGTGGSTTSTAVQDPYNNTSVAQTVATTIKELIEAKAAEEPKAEDQEKKKGVAGSCKP